MFMFIQQNRSGYLTLEVFCLIFFKYLPSFKQLEFHFERMTEFEMIALTFLPHVAVRYHVWRPKFWIIIYITYLKSRANYPNYVPLFIVKINN